MKLLRDETGLTISELLVVVALMSLLLGVVYFVMNAAGAMADGSIARAAASDESQMFVDRVGRELRQAQDPLAHTQLTPVGAFAEIGARRCVVYTDVSGDNRPEKVTYYESNGGMYRTVAVCTDAPMAATGYTHFASPGDPTKLVTELDPAWAGAVFTYYDSTNNAQTSAAKIPTISRVDVVMRAHAKSGSREVVAASSVTARLRSVLNSLGGS